MKRLSTVVAAVAAFALLGGVALAETDTDNQDVTLNVNEQAVIDVGVDPNVALTMTLPTVGGVLPVEDDDAGTWLNYTSVVSTSENTRRIEASIAVLTEVPAGTELLIESAAPTGDGTVGSTAGEVILSDSGQDIVTGIGSCNTGEGEFGANITFTFRVKEPTADNVGDLVADDDGIADILYTLTADAM